MSLDIEYLVRRYCEGCQEKITYANKDVLKGLIEIRLSQVGAARGLNISRKTLGSFPAPKLDKEICPK
ncbi:hypothetical protein CEXT_127321 [Caerostris extrusa]|uniref:Uncharacterized protein n=1 Tax=Caerostris extrusa TaxID=172846 RepID=A0AAV4Y4K6_CAEEX|nr:hypothetical protein CEXT_127321 [Caerostris extrusa]